MNRALWVALLESCSQKALEPGRLPTLPKHAGAAKTLLIKSNLVESTSYFSAQNFEWEPRGAVLSKASLPSRLCVHTNTLVLALLAMLGPKRLPQDSVQALDSVMDPRLTNWLPVDSGCCG